MKRKTKSSWKTTVFGTLAGLAGIAAQIPGPHSAIAGIVSAASLALLGVHARDNKVRSADVHGESTQPEYVPVQQIGRPGGTRPLE